MIKNNQYNHIDVSNVPLVMFKGHIEGHVRFDLFDDINHISCGCFIVFHVIIRNPKFIYLSIYMKPSITRFMNCV
jgi:hypothetical protein